MNDAFDQKIKALDSAIEDAEHMIQTYKRMLDEKQEVLEALRDRRVKYSL